MRRFLFLVLIMILVSTVFLAAQTSREEKKEIMMAFPAADFTQAIGFDFLESMFSMFSSINGILALPLEYQINLNGFVGLSTGITLAAVLSPERYYDSDTDTWIDYTMEDGLDILFALGPIFYFNGGDDDSIRGAFARVRGIIEYVGPAISDQLELDSSFQYGAEIHAGYNFVFGMFPHIKYHIAPEVGVRLMTYSSEIKLNFGVVFGNSF